MCLTETGPNSIRMLDLGVCLRDKSVMSEHSQCANDGVRFFSPIGSFGGVPRMCIQTNIVEACFKQQALAMLWTILCER